MTPLLLVLLAFALVLGAAGLLLWQWAQQQGRAQSTQAFVEQQLGRTVRAGPTASSPSTPSATPGSRRPGWWQALLLRAGVTPGAGLVLRLSVPPLLGLVLGLLAGGWVASLGLLLLGLCASLLLLWWQAGRRRERMIEQLPDCLDAMVRLLTLGNSLGAAFQTAVSGVPAPLSDPLQRAAALARSGLELDAALRQVAHLYRLRELYLVAAVIGLAIRFGGRSDQVLERMSGFMRDLQAARRELVALSAEVRLSAWILALLPLAVGGFILAFNQTLFLTMWDDPAGKRMLGVALALQLLGSWWLYRLAKSI